jgi:2-octaprenyl-6-methoxyphenol hydroxylase
MAPEAFDIAVVGQGLVGASFVLALNQLRPNKTLRVLHLDAQAHALVSNTSDTDERHLALNAFSVERLQHLDVQLPLAQCSAIRRVHISRAGDFGRVLLDAHEEGVDSFGHLVPAANFRAALDAALARVSLVDLKRQFESKLTAMHKHNDGYELNLDCACGNMKVHARFVVGADGTDSAVRAQMFRFDDAASVDDVHTYPQLAISFNCKAERDHAGTAFERFTTHGPIAVLPLPNRRIGVIWTLPIDEAKAAQQLPDAEFLAQFQIAFGYRLGRIDAVGKRTLWPLRRVRAYPDIAHRCVLIGNAAQTIHPLGAQGFNLGLRDALALANVVRQETFDQAALSAFSKARQKDRADTLRFSDSSLVATQNSSVLAKLVRQIAWGALESVPLAKRSLTRFGLGRTRSINS